MPSKIGAKFENKLVQQKWFISMMNFHIKGSSSSQQQGTAVSAIKSGDRKHV